VGLAREHRSERAKHRDHGALVLPVFVAGVLTAGTMLFLGYLRGPDALAFLDSRHDLVMFGLLVIPLLVCEALPIRVVRDGGVDEIVVSTTFAFAVLLAFGPVPVLIAQGAASVVADIVGRKSFPRAAFNLGQYWFAWGVAAVPLAVLGSPQVLTGRGELPPTFLLAVVSSAVVYFAVNNGLVGIVTGLDRTRSVAGSVLSAFRRESRTNLLLLAIGPIFLVGVSRSLALAPLMLVAVLAVYRSATLWVQKDYQAKHDPLTDLPNRALFNVRFDQYLSRARRSGLGVAVLLIDLDRFKEVNDTLGHGAGDALLQQVGPRISGLLSDDCIIARLGGDEFGVLVPDSRGPSHALARASAIVEGLEQPFYVDDGMIDVEASIGVALFPEHGDTKESLLQRADVAMYVAKSRQHAVELYSAANDHHSRRRLGLLADLRTALRDRELYLEYQPKVDLASGRIEAVEALIRWRHATYGPLSPDEFVPLAEQSGLIRPLTAYVLAEALAQVARWRDRGLDLSVSVNLSTRNLHDQRLPGELLDVLARNDLPARHLQLEITESVIMDDPDRARLVLDALDRMGIRLSIDDFGTGYSSLAYLQRLPVSEIKIDRSFVSDMDQNAANRVIVRSTIELARNLGLRVTAEGVESSRVLELLRTGGCDGAQGYFISRPLPAEQLESLIGGGAGADAIDAALAVDREPVIDLGRDRRGAGIVLREAVRLEPC